METVGSEYMGNGRCRFTVWAPEKKTMALHLVHPREREIAMECAEWGYFTAELEDASPDIRYYYKPEGEEGFPDPASHCQPEGVHGPSEVVDHGAYTWRDSNWKNIPMQDLVLYELHVGTFTPEGTFEAIIPRLDALKETGINAIELMPVAAFPGSRNWGYDGVFPYAVQASYGGPTGLKKLVDACHAKGIAVYLDVVYNHLGPEGNYFEKFGPYFTEKYGTPWGKAINYDGAYSDGVREYFANNTLYWLEYYHIDGLRLDAIHAIFDQSAVSFWELLQNKIQALTEQMGRSFYLIAESDLNNPRVVQQTEVGGYGFNAQWLDDFHHALYVLLDKEGIKFYEDFGKTEQFAKAVTEGFVHSGEYVKFRKKTFGTSSAAIPGNHFVAFAQNHDIVGNRPEGERLSVLVDFGKLKIAAAAVLLSSYIPMLFMGEEYGEETPFLYFVSHSDKGLIKAVQEGRKKEFADYKVNGALTDPQDEETFQRSKLEWGKRNQGKHQKLLKWHQTLIQLRRNHAVLQNFDKAAINAQTLEQDGLIFIRQNHDGSEHLICLFNFSEKDLSYTLPNTKTHWSMLLNSKEVQWLHEQEEEFTAAAQMAAGQVLTIPPLSVLVYQSQT
ncbi:malto-oligosyltrehalose trehalohydrolase [Pontibacter diazotrophicus]|uniref:Malto-oligosyltrehalose trehalohydrolase n=1 Tax=Pontibacter diazotrophicus TaxID=1400979 RepID=A0A3D8LBM7_9BACT|nr:malto-oligosyltrehalose trehalohydrolase [Pontibacter diazotrophicus]RDV14841.1 malto-oligosyltrehalose trehalohydrolase [Pontibacter diazotrophicus]